MRWQDLAGKFQPDPLVELNKVSKTSADIVLPLVLPFDSDEKLLKLASVFWLDDATGNSIQVRTHGVGVVSDMVLDRHSPHPGNVDVPAVYGMAARRIDGESVFV